MNQRRAKDSHQPFFQRHAAADLGNGLVGPIRPIWLIWREAYTTYTAAEVLDSLKGCGLRSDRASIPGDIVFVYWRVSHTPINEGLCLHSGKIVRSLLLHCGQVRGRVLCPDDSLLWTAGTIFST